jgi:hypothetical protein
VSCAASLSTFGANSWHSQIRGGIGFALAGRHLDRWQRDRGAVARGDPYRVDRLRAGHRSGRGRLGREPGAAWWQGALVIGPDPLFSIHKEQLAKLTVRHAIPAIYQYREFAAAGGLMSYGTSETEYYRLVGTYAGRVLKGDKPADLPVQQSTKDELFLNLKTAKALGITVPLPL